MNRKDKISRAFDAFMADTGPNDKREAIVIYRTPQDDHVPSRARALAARLQYIKTRAGRQKRAHTAIVEGYRKAGSRRLTRTLELAASTVGSGTLPVSQVEVTRRTLPALAEQPDVVAVLPNQKLHAMKPRLVDYKALSRTESRQELTWGLQMLGIPALWDTTKGERINVAVMDSGVHGDHRALSGRVRKFLVVDPLGRRIQAKPSFDSGQHGTHVCGTIAGNKTADGVSIGVAPEANLLVAGVLVGEATLRSLIEGISWAVQNGAHIMNMSLGFSYYEPKFVDLFDTLIEEFGILPVVAIGNENHGNTSSPGNAANALSVGALEKTSSRDVDVAFFSSGASLVFPDDTSGPLVTKPDVVAPGVQVYSCIPPQKRAHGDVEYGYMDGSSMASPHVAGVAALLMAAERNAQVSDIVTALKETAWHPKGRDGRPDNRWGYGMIQPGEALRALSS